VSKSPAELIADAVEGVDIKGIIRQQQDDAKDRRCLRGKHAPATGVCRVCKGNVVAEIDYPDDGLIGGPPRQGYVSGWHCESCQMVYRACPPLEGT